MARTATLLEMRTRAYQRGDFESRTTRFPTAEVTGLVNESIADLRDQLLRYLGTDYYESTVDITTSNAVSVYPLQADFMEVLDVYLNPGNGMPRFPLDRFIRRERAYLSDTTVAPYRGFPAYYILTGGNIEVLPVPSGVYTVTVRYVPSTTKLVNDGDTFDGINGWEEWVVVDVARKMATKERDTELVAVLERDLARLTDRIRAMAGARDRGSPRRVIDVRGTRGLRTPWRGGWR